VYQPGCADIFSLEVSFAQQPVYVLHVAQKV
jgi:hypothetical protein